MKLMFAYLRVHYKSIILFSAFALICAAVFSLYGVPPGAVIYSAALCLFTGTAVAAVSFVRFRSRHLIMQSLAKSISDSLDGLPEPSSLPEKDWRALIDSLYAAKSAAVSEYGSKLSGTKEYYTLWAHQIKTPIAAARLLLGSGGDPELHEQLRRIEQYVEMALFYLRSDSGTHDYVLREYPIDAIVRDTIRRCAPSFILKKLPLEYGGTELCAVTDSKWLSFVIEQLLSNSLKYTRSGSISIRTEGSSLIISDTGIGIAPEDIPRVCECGYTGYNGRADSKSTGIGLYLCSRILSGLGHGFSLRSVQGKGTDAVIVFDTVNRKYE